MRFWRFRGHEDGKPRKDIVDWVGSFYVMLLFRFTSGGGLMSKDSTSEIHSPVKKDVSVSELVEGKRNRDSIMSESMRSGRQ